MKKLNKLILLLTLLLPLNTYATKEFSTLTKVLISEGFLISNAILASKNPHAYGTFLAIFAPMGVGTPNSSTTTDWVSFFSAEALAVHNLRINENTKSENDIFKSNIIAWHLLGAVVLGTGYLMGDYDSDAKVTLNPTYHGGIKLAFNYKF